MAIGHSRVEEIFSCANEIESSADRVAYLNEACGDDASVRERVERLLDAAPNLGSFLEGDTDKLAVTLDCQIPDYVGSQIGPYQIREQLGEGGMGIVYVAEQVEPVRRKVALKIIKPGMDTHQVIARFEAERQTLAMMDHPGIARVIDAGSTDEGRPYFVMDLIRGIPITDYCDFAQMTTPQRLELFASVCNAVQHAHQKGIIHRDLKPSNVMVTEIDSHAVAKVIDFGVAKATGGQVSEETVYSQFSQMIGTPLYMSPEQAGLSGLDIDTRSDVYSLGVMLYELLTGSTPFDRDQLRQAGYDEMRRIIREDEPARPSHRIDTLNAADSSTISERRGVDARRLQHVVQGELDWIVMRALEKDRNRRYESASKFTEDIQHYLNDQPVQACPPSALYRFQKLARRNRVLLTTTALVAVALLVGTGVSLWQANDARAARDLAAENLVLAQQNQVEAEEATAREKAQRERAEENFKQARAAVDTYLTKISEDELLNQPGMQPLRKDLLELALDYYQEFIEQQPDDPDVQAELADAYERVGEITSQIGSTPDALKAHQAELKIREKLVTLHPANLDYQKDLSESKYRLAGLHEAIGQSDQALAFNQEAITICEQLVAQNPDVLEYQGFLATSYEQLGSLHLVFGQIVDAQTVFKKVMTIREQLVEKSPEDLDYQNRLAGTYQNLATQHGRKGLSEEALAYHLKALAICELLVEKSPEVLDYQHQLAITYQNLAVTHSLIGQKEEALANYLKAITIRELLVEKSPEVLHYQNGLDSLYGNLAVQHFKMGQTEEALAYQFKALAIRELLVEKNPEVLKYQDGLAGSYETVAFAHFKIGQTEEALTSLRKALTIREKLAALSPEDILYREHLARSYMTLGAIHQESGDQEAALTSLHKAITIQEKLAALSPEDILYRVHVARSYMTLGAIHHESDDEEAAVSAWTKLIRLGDDVGQRVTGPGFSGYVGRAHYFLGNWQEARASLEKGIELLGDKEPTLIGGPRWWYLAMTLHQLGEVEQARTYYDQLVKELEQNPSTHPHNKYRAEAAEVLGIEIPTEDNTEETPTEKSDVGQDLSWRAGPLRLARTGPGLRIKNNMFHNPKRERGDPRTPRFPRSPTFCMMRW